MRNNVVKYFLEKTNFKEEEILSVEEIFGGHSKHHNFLFSLNNHKKYHVKLVNGGGWIKVLSDIVKLYSPSKYLYIDDNGNFIKQWIDGQKPNLKNKNEAKLVLQEIHKFHNLNVRNIKLETFGVDVYLKTTKIEPKLIAEFSNIKKVLLNMKQTVIHGDINLENMLIDGTRAYLIDLEWVRMGWPILDYAYLAAFTNIKKQEVLNFTGYDKKLFEDIIRFVLIHTLMWCEYENSHKAKELKNNILNQLRI